jgi:hypothetical protein
MNALSDDLEYEEAVLTEGGAEMSPEEKKDAENRIFDLK